MVANLISINAYCRKKKEKTFFFRFCDISCFECSRRVKINSLWECEYWNYQEEKTLVNRQKNSKLPRVTLLSALIISVSAWRSICHKTQQKKSIVKSVLKPHSDFPMNMKGDKGNISSGVMIVWEFISSGWVCPRKAKEQKPTVSSLVTVVFIVMDMESSAMTEVKLGYSQWSLCIPLLCHLRVS